MFMLSYSLSGEFVPDNFNDHMNMNVQSNHLSNEYTPLSDDDCDGYGTTDH